MAMEDDSMASLKQLKLNFGANRAGRARKDMSKNNSEDQNNFMPYMQSRDSVWLYRNMKRNRMDPDEEPLEEED